MPLTIFITPLKAPIMRLAGVDPRWIMQLANVYLPSQLIERGRWFYDDAVVALSGVAVYRNASTTVVCRAT